MTSKRELRAEIERLNRHIDGREECWVHAFDDGYTLAAELIASPAISPSRRWPRRSSGPTMPDRCPLNLDKPCPTVRTVGDLTARHIGKRVRLDEHYDAKLETIFAHEGGEVSLNFTHPGGFAFGCSRPLDTPCEVIE